MFVFPNNSEQYVACTYNNSTLTGTLYTNGVLVATQTYPNTYLLLPATSEARAARPRICWETTCMVIGNLTAPSMSFGYGMALFHRCMLAVSAAAGPSVVVTNLTPSSRHRHGHQYEHDWRSNPTSHRVWKFRAGIQRQCHRWRHQLDQQQPECSHGEQQRFDHRAKRRHRHGQRHGQRR